MHTDGERWVTIAEAAEALGRSQRTIRRWARAGRLPSDRSGPLILVDVAGYIRDAGLATAATTAATTADMTGQVTAEIETLRAERDALRAEGERLAELLAEVRSERDYLRQVHALTVSSEQRLLTEGTGGQPRRRWRWPWQRGRRGGGEA